jgi:serine/threonine-protein kinase RsbW
MTPVDPHNESTYHICVVKSDLREAEIPKKEILDEIERHQFDECSVFAVKLALEEALTNAVKHGNCCDPTKPVTVRYAVTDDEIIVIVRDEGEGFEPNKIPDPTAPDRLPIPNGRGIMLLNAYLDKVEYRDGGREVYMLKRRVPGKS